MPESIDQRRAMLESLQKSGAVDFDKIANVVKEVGPQLTDTGLVAADYIATGVSSVIHVWKTGLEAAEGLDSAENLRREIKRVVGP